MRLINEDDVLKLIADIKDNRDIPKNYGTLMDLEMQIRNLPTAYNEREVIHETSNYLDGLVKDIIYIIEKGGVE